MAIDRNDNILITGYFESSFIQFGSTTVINEGDADIFILKLNGSGNVLWAKTAGGIDTDMGTGIVTD